jgi:glycosyltransferase involved in cell wall biosynthesis
MASTSSPSPIAVVIPVYNGEKYIAKAIESALAQTRLASEIVVVDDASTDRTPEILQRFRDRERIKLLRLDERVITPAAWNAAVRASSAPYFLVLAHDDEIDPRFIESAEDQIRKFPDSDFIAFSYRAINSGGTWMADMRVTRFLKREGPIDKTTFLDHFTPGQFFLPSFTVTRRSAFDALGGFEERLRVAYDWEFYLRAGLSCQFVFSSQILGSYRIHEQQSIAAHTTRDNGDNDVLFEKLSKIDGQLSEAQMKLIIQNMCDFVRRFATLAVANRELSASQVMEIRKNVQGKLRQWKSSPASISRYVTMKPSNWRQKLVWTALRWRWTTALVRPITRRLGY